MPSRNGLFMRGLKTQTPTRNRDLRTRMMMMIIIIIIIKNKNSNIFSKMESWNIKNTALSKWFKLS
jgi:hypothetical protein